MSRVEPGLRGAIIEEADGIDANGRRVRATNWVITPKQADEILHGYRCAKCKMGQPEAWRDECIEPYCRFPIRAENVKCYEFEFAGERPYGPTDAEFDDEREFWTEKSGILVPRSAS